MNGALQARIEAASPRACAEGDDGRHIWQEVRRFYKQGGYQFVWSDGNRVRAQTDDLIQSLRAADQEGLNPADYHPEELNALARARMDEARAVDLELQATCRYLTYAWHLAHGSSDPEDIDSHWHRAPRDIDLHQALENGIADNQISASLVRIAPASPQYQGLKHQLARYRAMPRDPDVDARIERIVLNLERWRWMPDELGARYILVNIPAFHLDAIEGGKSVLGMKVVVGKPDNPTPVLADRMTSIVFSPYWNIPPDIVRKETLPHALKDRGYLERNHIEIVRNGGAEGVDPSNVDWNRVDLSTLRFRQKPGRGNSLGGVKFVFPNHFNVYLHDTPSQSLFERIERDFSHGCVRLERPADLARYVLRDQPSWTDEKIEQAMRVGIERSVPLKESLPVYLTYFTAWEENGDVQFGDDVYHYDARQKAPAGL